MISIFHLIHLVQLSYLGKLSENHEFRHCISKMYVTLFSTIT